MAVSKPWFSATTDVEARAVDTVTDEFNLNPQQIGEIENYVAQQSEILESMRALKSLGEGYKAELQQCLHSGQRGFQNLSMTKANYEDSVRSIYDRMKKSSEDLQQEITNTYASQQEIENEVNDTRAKIKQIEDKTKTIEGDFDRYKQDVAKDANALSVMSSKYSKGLKVMQTRADEQYKLNINRANQAMQEFTNKYEDSVSTITEVRDIMNRECGQAKQALNKWNSEFDKQITEFQRTVKVKQDMMDSLHSEFKNSLRDVDNLIVTTADKIKPMSEGKQKADKIMEDVDKIYKDYKKVLDKDYQDVLNKMKDATTETEVAYHLLEENQKKIDDLMNQMEKLQKDSDNLTRTVKANFQKAASVATNFEQYLQNMEERYLSKARVVGETFERLSQRSGVANTKINALSGITNVQDGYQRVVESNEAYARAQNSAQAVPQRVDQSEFEDVFEGSDGIYQDNQQANDAYGDYYTDYSYQNSNDYLSDDERDMLGLNENVDTGELAASNNFYNASLTDSTDDFDYQQDMSFSPATPSVSQGKASNSRASHSRRSTRAMQKQKAVPTLDEMVNVNPYGVTGNTNAQSINTSNEQFDNVPQTNKTQALPTDMLDHVDENAIMDEFNSMLSEPAPQQNYNNQTYMSDYNNLDQNPYMMDQNGDSGYVDQATTFMNQGDMYSDPSMSFADTNNMYANQGYDTMSDQTGGYANQTPEYTGVDMNYSGQETTFIDNGSQAGYEDYTQPNYMPEYGNNMAYDDGYSNTTNNLMYNDAPAPYIPSEQQGMELQKSSKSRRKTGFFGKKN